MEAVQCYSWEQCSGFCGRTVHSHRPSYFFAKITASIMENWSNLNRRKTNGSVFIVFVLPVSELVGNRSHIQSWENNTKSVGQLVRQNRRQARLTKRKDSCRDRKNAQSLLLFRENYILYYEGDG